MLPWLHFSGRLTAIQHGGTGMTLLLTSQAQDDKNTPLHRIQQMMAGKQLTSLFSFVRLTQLNSRHWTSSSPTACCLPPYSAAKWIQGSPQDVFCAGQLTKGCLQSASMQLASDVSSHRDARHLPMYNVLCMNKCSIPPQEPHPCMPAAALPCTSSSATWNEERCLWLVMSGTVRCGINHGINLYIHMHISLWAIATAAAYTMCITHCAPRTPLTAAALEECKCERFSWTT